MADLKITAEFGDLQLLKRELVNLPKHAKASASVFEREFLKVERQLNKTATAHQKYYTQLQRQNLANKSAENSADIFTRGLAAQERQIDSLRSKYNPLYAASKLYERTLEELDTAHKIGAISTAQHAAQVDMLETEYQQFATGAAGAMNRFAAAQNRSSRGMNAMGVGMQQAGYQIGDFLVQVQSGTNWMVAFGQQATQLVGILPMFNSVMGVSGTALVGLSAGLGIIIPLATAFGAIIMRSRSESNSATGGIVTFTQAMSRAREEISSTNQELDAFNRGLTDVTEGVIEGEIRRLESEIRTLAEVARLAEERNTRVGTIAPTPEGEGVEALRLEAARAALAAAQEELALLLQARDLERARTDMLDQQARAQELLLAGERARAEIRQRDYQSTQNMQAQIDLQRAILEYGEDSLEVAILMAEQEALSLRLSASGTREYVAQSLELRGIVSQQEAAVRLEERRLAILQEVTEKTEVLERTFESLFDTSADSLVAEIARVAEQLGIATDEALKLALALPIGHSGITGGRGTVGMPGGTFNPARDLAIYDDDPESGGGGGSGLNFVETLQREMEIRTRLLGLGREEAELQTEIDRITTGLGENRNQYSDEFIANLARQNLALQEQEDLAERLMQTQEDFAQTVSESFGDALMSIIDGTKSTEDAFKAMAATIIRELYDILVVQQLVGSIRDSIGGSNLIGSFFSSMAGRASGGTMNANQPYLVGERGPEIVMPGRQSTVTNANLTRNAASQDSAPVVNMTYNFQGGITEADLARAMPMMVEKTKAAVVDTVQRGGSMARVFR